MPDDHVLRWACRRCVVARTGWTFPVQVWASAHDDVRPRHDLWIGKSVFAPEQQLDLSRTPDVICAQRRYWRLRRRYGPIATGICQSCDPPGGRPVRFDRRSLDSDQVVEEFDPAVESVVAVGQAVPELAGGFLDTPNTSP
ncbi:hypothetical protein [Streptomyces shenzhenensis]|uniref:hypothetical protein n=1 Tax=Streptomyces shenzhenensis TaxID=943815 RepID=UPI00369EAE67